MRPSAPRYLTGSSHLSPLYLHYLPRLAPSPSALHQSIRQALPSVRCLCLADERYHTALAHALAHASVSSLAGTAAAPREPEPEPEIFGLDGGSSAEDLLRMVQPSRLSHSMPGNGDVNGTLTFGVWWCLAQKSAEGEKLVMNLVRLLASCPSRVCLV